MINPNELSQILNMVMAISQVIEIGFLLLSEDLHSTYLIPFILYQAKWRNYVSSLNEIIEFNEKNFRLEYLKLLWFENQALNLFD